MKKSNSRRELLWERIAGSFNGAGGVLLGLTLSHTIDLPLWVPVVIAFFPTIVRIFIWIYLALTGKEAF